MVARMRNDYSRAIFTDERMGNRDHLLELLEFETGLARPEDQHHRQASKTLVGVRKRLTQVGRQRKDFLEFNEGKDARVETHTATIRAP